MTFNSIPVSFTFKKEVVIGTLNGTNSDWVFSSGTLVFLTLFPKGTLGRKDLRFAGESDPKYMMTEVLLTTLDKLIQPDR